METYNDSDDNGRSIVLDGDKDQDIQSDTKHAAGQLDPEGNEEVELEGVVIVIHNMLLEKYYIRRGMMKLEWSQQMMKLALMKRRA